MEDEQGAAASHIVGGVDSVRSFSSLTTNLRLIRRPGRDSELTLDVFNLFDREVNDIQ